MTVESFTEIVGWCLVINISALVLFFALWSVFKEGLARFISRLFGVSEEQVKTTMFQIFFQWRLLFFFFNVVPYVALLIVS